jgi:hypothetical protein
MELVKNTILLLILYVGIIFRIGEKAYDKDPGNKNYFRGSIRVNLENSWTEENN